MENEIVDATAAQGLLPPIAPEIIIEDAATPEVEPKGPSFDDFGLHPDVRVALEDMGYFTPTPVQAGVFHQVTEGKDLMVQSRTGTGKTTAFGLPIVNRMIPAECSPQALILCPTRELALQVARELTSLGKHRGIKIEALYGGAPIGKQIAALHQGVHVVVGTPGRVQDHIARKTLALANVQQFVLDECDEMLSMGFLEDIERINAQLPAAKQTLLFSATMPDEVTRFARRHMRQPETLSHSTGDVSVANIRHGYYIVSGIARGRDLLKIIFAENPDSAIIFCNMRDETTLVAKFLQKQGLDAEPLSSDLSQSERERVMGRMKKHDLRFLVATDVAARGIDISDLSHVINYSFPDSPEVYVHRTGRTGRAGKHGTALSIVGPRDLAAFRMLNLTYKVKQEERRIPGDEIFEGKLKHPLPPVGAPANADPVAILVRALAGTPNDLERSILDKMLAKEAGRKALAMLVAEKLNQLTTRNKPRQEARLERTERDPEEAPRARDAEREGRGRFEGRDRGEGRSDNRFDGRDRSEPRGEGRSDNRFDGRDRSEPRGEGRTDNRFDGRDRSEPRGEGRTDNRFEGRDRSEPRGEGRTDNRFEGRDRSEPRGEGRERSEPRGEGRSDNRFDGRDRSQRSGHRVERTDARSEGRTDSRPDRGENRAEPRTDARPEIRTDARPEIRTDARPEIRTDRNEARADRNDVRTEPRGDNRAELRTDSRPEIRTDRPEARTEGRPERGDRTDARSERGDRNDARPERGDNRSDTRDRHRADGRHRNEHRNGRSDKPFDPSTLPAAHDAQPVVSDSGFTTMKESQRPSGKPEAAKPQGGTAEFWETWAAEKSAKAVKASDDAATVTASPESTNESEAPSAKRGKPTTKSGRNGRSKEAAEPATHIEAKPDAKSAKAKPVIGKGKDKAVKEPEAKPRGGKAAAGLDLHGGDPVKLSVNLGKKHGLTPDDLRGILAKALGGDRALIGSVLLRAESANVKVPGNAAAVLEKALNGTKHQGETLRIERA